MSERFPKPFSKSATSVLSRNQDLTRRRGFLQWMTASTCGLIGSSALSKANSAEMIQANEVYPKNPEEALKKLLDGNKRFAAGNSLAVHRDISRVREVAAVQKPFAAFLGCADSRVPIEIVFDQGFGDLFVTRLAGNISSSENIGSLEFGTQILGAKVLFVLCHTDCGAVMATMKGGDVPGQISGLFQYIRPAVKSANGDLSKAIAENVRNQATILAEASTVISKLIQRKELIVVGGIYDLKTGLVSVVDTPVS